MESNLNIYLINPKKYLKGKNILLDDLIRIVENYKSPLIIEIEEKCFLNNFLDKLIIDSYSKQKNNFIIDYKKIQDFKDDAFYQFSQYFACMTFSVILEERNIYYQFYFINSLLITFTTEKPNESFIEKTLIEKLKFSIFQGNFDKFFEFHTINSDKINSDQMIYSTAKKRSIKVNKSELKKQKTLKFKNEDYKKSIQFENFQKEEKERRPNFEDIQIYDESDISSDNELLNIGLRNKNGIVSSIKNLKFVAPRNSLLINIAKNIPFGDLNIEYFYYNLFLRILSPIENRLLKAFQRIKKIEDNLFNDDELESKKEFAQRMSELEEYLLEIKSLITMKKNFLDNTQFNFDILSLGGLRHKRNKALKNRIEIFKKRMIIFISHLQIKCEELNYYVFKIQYIISTLKDHYKTTLNVSEFSSNRDFNKIIWKCTMTVCISLLFNLLSNFLGTNISIPFQTNQIGIFWGIVGTGLLLTYLQLITVMKSNLFKQAFN